MEQISQNTEEWLEMRRGKIGASDVSTILGLNPKKTAYQLYLEKLGEVETDVNWAMQKGTRVESRIRDQYEELTGNLVLPKVFVHPQHFWLMASCDGVNFEGNRLAEFKFRGKEVVDKVFLGEIPEYDMPQLQIQMECSGIEFNDYVAWYEYVINYKPVESIAYTTAKRNRAWFSEVLPKLEAFYECLVSKRPPEMTYKDYVIQDGEERQQIADRLKVVLSLKDELIEEEKDLKAHLIRMSDGRNTKGCGVKVFASPKPGAVQYDQIPELKTVDLNHYRKPSYTKWTVKLDER